MTIESMIKSIAKGHGVDIDKLLDCDMLSKGDACKCHLCLVDTLVSLADKNNN